MSSLSPSALSVCVREVAAFVDAAGWDQPLQLFALVATADLVAAEPQLAQRVTAGSELTPVAQEALPGGVDGRPPELDTALAAVAWPDGVAGCALVQEVLILPPEAEAVLDAAGDAAGVDEEAALHAAMHHADRREARVIAAVLRDGPALCLLQLRAHGSTGETPELLEHPDLAPNLVDALRATFAP
ncbi:MAG: PPA1309 family protein [Mycobacteriaceae bacterium]